jgi:DNA-directed RNA polymerase specialized sigma24 family protein
VLRHYVGLTEQESALTLDCSVGNVKRLTFRGLAQLRAALEQPQPASAQDPDSPAARRVHRQETS